MRCHFCFPWSIFSHSCFFSINYFHSIMTVKYFLSWSICPWAHYLNLAFVKKDTFVLSPNSREHPRAIFYLSANSWLQRSFHRTEIVEMKVFWKVFGQMFDGCTYSRHNSLCSTHLWEVNKLSNFTSFHSWKKCWPWYSLLCIYIKMNKNALYWAG